MKREPINTDNYELWFVDHIDGELTDAEELILKDFLVANPSLAVDLESIKSISLSPSPSSFPNKASLKIPNEEELAIMLAAEEGQDYPIEKTINPTAADKLLKSFQSTLLKADESIIFTNKDDLKRKAGILIPLWIQRTAIAASIIGVVAALLLRTEADIYSPRTETAESIDIEYDPSINMEEWPMTHISPVENQITEVSHEAKPIENLVEEAPTPISPIKENILVAEEKETPESIEEKTEDSESPETNFAKLPEEQVQEPLEDLEIHYADNSVSISNDDNQGSTTEIKSVLDVLKKATSESDVLALESLNGEEPYVQASLKVGRFGLSIKRKRN